MDPAKFWHAVCNTARNAARDAQRDPVQAVCLSAHGETLIPVDAKNEPIGPAILNIDNRATTEAGWVEKTIGSRRIFDITGLVAHPMYPVPKILWLRQHQPALYSAAKRFLSVTDFLHAKLGLPPCVGYSLASRFLAFDVRKNSWSDEILAAVGLKFEQLPMPVPAGTILGKLNSEAAIVLGVPVDTPVVVGGHDQACGALGVGVIEAGRVSDSMGTYECLGAATDEPRLNDEAFAARLNSYSHVVSEKFLTLAYFPSGIMLKWFHDLLYGSGSSSSGTSDETHETESYAELEAATTDAPTELCITPHLIGTCNPDFDPRARGVILGLSSDTNRNQIYQGILEGIACELAQAAEMLARAVGAFSDLYVTGGGTRSARGLKLRAAITRQRLHVMGCDEAVCQGAAILAGVAVGVYPAITAGMEQVVRENKIVEPDARIGAAYSRQLNKYRSLCTALKSLRSEDSY